MFTAEQTKELHALPVRDLIFYWDELEAAGRKDGKLNQVVRMLCLADLYYLLVRVCGRVDMLPCVNRPGFIDNQFAFERCREVEAHPDGYLDLWSREHWKDLADDTPMLTANRGWTTHGELKAGDVVFSPEGLPVDVLAVTEQYLNSECYRLFFSDGSSLVAGAGHEWRLRRKIKRRVANSNLRKIEFVDYFLTTGEMASRDGRLDVGTCAPLNFGGEQSLPIDPYLLGCWLGDGNSNGAVITMLWEDAQPMLRQLEASGHTWVARKTGSRALSFSIDKRDRNAVCIRGHKRTPENVYRHSCRECKKQYQRHKLFGDKMEPITVKGFVWELRKLGLLCDPHGLKNGGRKHIPEIYLKGSIAQRMDLLRGLMDSDGTCGTRGSAMFSNTNEILAKQVYELASGLGLQPHIRLNSAKNDCAKSVNGKYLSWQVCFQAHKERNPFRIKRKADRAIPESHYYGNRTIVKMERIASVPTHCIQVAGGMYVAGKELIPTHNSTIITFGLTLQDVLRDPEITIGIFSHTRPVAKAFLRMLMREIETNRALHAAFPDVLCGSDVRQYAKFSEDDGVIVKRKTNPNEATIEAWGLVDGQPTSKHFRILLYDDVVVAGSVTTPEMIAKVMLEMERSYNLGTTPGAKRGAGTRWHFNDAYRTVVERNTFILRAHPGREGGTEEGKSVLWNEETHAKKRAEQGPYTYAAQILLNPKADALQGFQRAWIRKYKTIKPETLNWYILCDSASSKKKGSDYTAYWAVGLGRDGNYYCVPEVRDRLNLKERGDRLFDLHRKYKPKQVRYEKFGLLSDIEHFEARMENENYRFTITEVAGQTSKVDRIKRLIPLFEAGRIWLPESHNVTDWQKYTVDLVSAFVEEEYMGFPHGLHDDLLDSLARICEPELKIIWPREEKVVLEENRPRVANSATAWMM